MLGKDTRLRTYLRRVSIALSRTILASPDLMTPLVLIQPDLGFEGWLTLASNAQISSNLHSARLGGKREVIIANYSVKHLFTGDIFIARHAYYRFHSCCQNQSAPKKKERLEF